MTNSARFAAAARLRLRRLSVVAIIVGLALPAGTFLLTAGTYLPYQDAPPEIAQKYAAETARADRANDAARAVGLPLAVAGVVLLTYVSVRARRTQEGQRSR
ncbi:hypothetical protein [Actinopolymorpha alba]|uniref:hypothetical protein n=1 Tax=Actinopolymorpha alba TaxID=533267 RepID=UPI00036BCCF1|nr:hypothetical protein [Actinopolymorpha alba]